MKVPTARRLMTSLMTSRDYDVIFVTSQYSRSSHLEEPGSTIRVNPFKAYIVEHCVKISSFGLDLWEG